MLGIVVATASWGFHVAALALAPISLVQSVIAGGLVLLTVVADRLFGFTRHPARVDRRGADRAGLAFLAATLEGTADAAPQRLRTGHADRLRGRDVRRWACGGRGRLAPSARGGFPLLAVAAGLIWGASDVSIKALSGSIDDGLGRPARTRWRS